MPRRCRAAERFRLARDAGRSDARRRSAAGRRPGWSRSAHPTPRSVMLRLDVARPGRPPARPALRDPADGRRRLRRAAVVLDRVARRPIRWSSCGSSGWRTARCPGSWPTSSSRVTNSQVRGPIGGWFVWDGATPGGRGWPAAAERCRWWRCCGTPRYVGRSGTAAAGRLRADPADLPYPDELAAAGALIALSRTDQPRSAGRAADGRRAPAAGRSADATTFVCGSAGFAEFASSLLVELGCPVGGRPGGAVRAERLIACPGAASPGALRYAGHRPLG